MSQPSISNTIEGYQAAVFAKDIDAFVALYAEHVHVFDMWGEWVYRGRVAWRSMVEGWFGSLGSERVAVEVSEVESTVSEALAVVHAIISYTSMSEAGVALRSMQNRITWVLERHDSKWMIIHEHSSAPLDFESGKVILQR